MSDYQTDNEVDNNNDEDELIDLDTLDTTAACNKPFRLELKHPTTGKGLKQYIWLLGRDSDTFQSVIRERADRQVLDAAEYAQRGESPPPRLSEQADREAIELYTACTTKWENIKFGGQVRAFTEANAHEFYSKLWVRRQIDKAIGQLENFMQN